MGIIEGLPEIRALDSRESLIRIPSQQDVPVTPRIRKLIDSKPLRRLANIRQLGLVALVFPGATHSRFEHSLGVYRMSLLFLKRLASVSSFANCVDEEAALRFIVAALLHDVGHWPYCHPMEDMDLDSIPDHEQLAVQRLTESEVPKILYEDFGLTLDCVTGLLHGKSNDPVERILQSMLSGPIDVDKMDYLYRDSLHAGVPYGMHYDQSRLIGSLCLNVQNNALAITSKGTTAAELMVFARYVMFSEVYWHHAVRSGTAMLQRAFYDLQESIDCHEIFDSNDESFHRRMLQLAGQNSTNEVVAAMIRGLFGDQRRLYKRLAQCTVLESPELFNSISHRPYSQLVAISNRVAQLIRDKAGLPIQDGQVLIDAPPVGLEVQFQIPVRDSGGQYRQLGQLSPVVRALAEDQFDNYVKRVRVFVAPQYADQLEGQQVLDWLEEAV